MEDGFGGIAGRPLLMPAAYFDSSAVLAFVLGQPEGSDTLELWSGMESRCSSILLKAECLINIRKHAGRLPKGASGAWLRERSLLLESCLDEIHLKDVDASVLTVLDRETGLAECRTLDALHLATALHMRERASEGFKLVTLDERMRQTAAKLKFDILPSAA
jgi:predicted nucleic acid-binding protein